MEQDTEKKGKKTIWEIIKFLLVSAIASIVQIVLSNVLPLIFDSVTATIPGFLQGIFDPSALWDVSTESGLASFNKYTVGGVVTWGYVLPFFLANVIANIYAYIHNKKTTFKSDAPKRNFVFYLIILFILILFSTWMQGQICGWITASSSTFLKNMSRTIASLAAGAFQMIVLYPLEKFVFFKSKKPEKEQNKQ